MLLRSILLFILAALAEIGGAWLVWQSVREQRGWLWAGLGVIALGIYGFVATMQPDAHFGRILAAYGGIFVAGSLAWGMAVDGFRPDRWDVIGAVICLAAWGHHVRATHALVAEAPQINSLLQQYTTPPRWKDAGAQEL